MAVPTPRQITIRPLGAAVLVLLTGVVFTIFLFLLTVDNSFLDVTTKASGFETESDADVVYRSENHLTDGNEDDTQDQQSSIQFQHQLSQDNDEHVDRYFGIKIDSRVSDLPDTRPLLCTQLVYKEVLVYGRESRGNGFKSVTLILVYNDYQFYELKKTISSLILTNSFSLIGEIIVVDDASSLDYISQEAKQYFSKIPHVKLMKTSTDEPIGMSKARNLAAKEAEFEILVFMDVTVVVGVGWLEPLLDPIVRGNGESIVVPHMDLITDPVGMRRRVLPDNTTYTITWSLSIRPFQFNQPNSDNWQPTDIAPAVRGDVFAITRKFFNKIGGYDEELDEYGGGEHVDLSLKAWFCGNGIVLATCSRVAVTNALDPVKMRSKNNRNRLTNIWFSEKEIYKTAIHRLSGSNLDASFSYENPKEEGGLIASVFSKTVGRPDGCKKASMSRYIGKVAVNMVELRKDALGYGLLQTGTYRFARIIFVNNNINNHRNRNRDNKKTSDSNDIKIKIKLDECQPAIVTDPRVNNNNNNNININNNNIVDDYQPSIFQLTTSRTITTKINNVDLCLTTKDNAYLTFEQCRNDNTNNIPNIDNKINGNNINNINAYLDKQKFIYDPRNNTIVNVWSKYCVMQVTDPDTSTPGDRQIAMVQPCDSYSGEDRGFMNWVFFNL